MTQGYAGKEHSNPTAQTDRWRDVRSESITPTQQQITAGYQGHHCHSRVKHNKENIFPYLIVHDCFISTVSYLHSLPAPASYYKLCAAKLLNFHQSRVGMTDFNRDHGVLVIILQGNIFVELRTNLYLCRRRLRSQGARHGVMRFVSWLRWRKCAPIY